MRSGRRPGGRGASLGHVVWFASGFTRAPPHAHVPSARQVAATPAARLCSAAVCFRRGPLSTTSAASSTARRRRCFAESESVFPPCSVLLPLHRPHHPHARRRHSFMSFVASAARAESSRLRALASFAILWRLVAVGLWCMLGPGEPTTTLRVLSGPCFPRGVRGTSMDEREAVYGFFFCFGCSS